jgi:ADP-ribosyl-[dinitrogen reductase] hydrolase
MIPAILAATDPADDELAPLRGLRARYQGAMLGLAVGDALAAATQFRRPGSFTPVGDLLGGGPFDLPCGAWSDDTAMALCLAESLVECEGFDARDQLERYGRWQRDGYLSATGQCLGITAGTARALSMAPEPHRAGGGAGDPEALALPAEPLSRVAPVVLHAFAEPERAVALAAEAARATCRSGQVQDACRALAAMLHAALRGEPRERILAPAGAVLAAGGAPEESRGALAVLERACWAFGSTGSFREGALRAVNLGGDSDVIGAVYGQIAGAHYGVEAIPAPWRRLLAREELIVRLGDGLLSQALLRLAELGAES